MNESAMI